MGRCSRYFCIIDRDCGQDLFFSFGCVDVRRRLPLRGSGAADVQDEVSKTCACVRVRLPSTYVYVQAVLRRTID